MSGSPAVTLSIANGSGGANTYGEFATGTFIADATTETFDWNGAGSTYTVLGEISVFQLPPLPGVPTGLTATGSDGRVDLSWTAGSGATSYNVKRSTTSNEEVTITNIAGTSYTDTGVTAGTTYYYEVSATNNNGESANSSEASATPTANIAWVGPTGITGDANLYTNGTYVDAIIPNALTTYYEDDGPQTVDGVTFNAAVSQGGDGNTYGDGVISFDGGGDTLYKFQSPGYFPVGGPASSAFATLMDDGGVFQFGSSGSGTVTISGFDDWRHISGADFQLCAGDR